MIMPKTANMPPPTEPEDGDNGIALLQSTFASLRAENTFVKQTNIELERRVEELQAQLGHAEATVGRLQEFIDDQSEKHLAALRQHQTASTGLNLDIEGGGKRTSMRKRKVLMLWVFLALVVVVVLCSTFMRGAQVQRRGFGLLPDGTLWVPKRSPNYPGEPVDDFMHLW